MVCCLFGYKYRIGNKGAVKYNAKTGRLWPSDIGFTLCTLTLILGPSSLCFMYAIILAETLNTLAKVLLVLFYLSSIYMSLRNLYKCSFTEPGIIPTLSE